MKIRHIRITALAAVLSTGLGYAEEDVRSSLPEATTVVQLEETTLDSETQTRYAEVEVLTSDELEKRQINNAEDLVRMMPGVSVSKGDDRWGGSGFNIRGLDEDRVAINVDGIPQGETLKYEGGQAYGYFKGSRNGLDVEAIKSVEVVKGADSILSGSGALAGAVNFTTKDAYDFLAQSGNDSALVLKGGYAGSNTEWMGSVTGANRTGKLESLIIYTHRDGNEYKNYDMGGADVEGSAREIPDPRDVETDSVLAKFAYNFDELQSLGFVYSNYERNSITDTQSFNGGWYTNRFGDDLSKTERFGLFYDLQAEGTFFDTLSATLDDQSIDFTANTLQHVMFNFGPTFSADEDRVDSRSYDQDILQLKVDFNKELESAGLVQDLIYGIAFRERDFVNIQTRTSNSNLNDLGWVESNIGSLIPTSESNDYSLYFVDTLEFEDSSKLRAGVRFDEYRYDAFSDENYGDDTGTLGETDFSAFTWTLGYQKDITEGLTASAGVSTGFRVPTIEEMYQTSGSLDDWGTVPNPDLKPESSTNFDIALSGNNDYGSFRLGYFYSKYDDFIEYLQVEGINTNTGLTDPDGYFVPANVGEVEVSGFELFGSLNMSEAFHLENEGFSATFQAAITEGENKLSGDPLYTVQPWSASLGFDYSDPSGVWGASLFSTYTSGKDNNDSYSTEDDGSITYPLYLSNSAFIVDLIGRWNVTDNFHLTGGVYNLTDKEYYNWDNVRFVDQGDLRPGIGVTGDGVKRYSEPGINFKVSATLEF